MAHHRRREAAIDDKLRGIDVARLVRCQEQHRMGDVPRFPDLPARHHIAPGLHVIDIALAMDLLEPRDQAVGEDVAG
jgi:hypothetical protein